MKVSLFLTAAAFLLPITVFARLSDPQLQAAPQLTPSTSQAVRALENDRGAQLSTADLQALADLERQALTMTKTADASGNTAVQTRTLVCGGLRAAIVGGFQFLYCYGNGERYSITGPSLAAFINAGLSLGYLVISAPPETSLEGRYRGTIESMGYIGGLTGIQIKKESDPSIHAFLIAGQLGIGAEIGVIGLEIVRDR